MELTNLFVGVLSSGQHDLEEWKANDSLSRIHHDGKTYFYNASGMSLDEFQIAAEVAFEMDVEEAILWGDHYRIDF